MANQNEEVLRKTCDAMAKGDMETFFGLHADDTLVHIVGHGAAAGDHKGRQAFKEAFQQMGSTLDGPPGWKTHDIVANDKHAVVMGEQTFTKGGQTLNAPITVVTHIANGKIAEAWVVPMNQPELERFLA